MNVYLVVALGGAIGSVARAGISAWGASLFGTAMPWATIAINIAGSFVIGYAAMLTASDSRFAVSPELRAFILVGFCGGFTTFSSFSQQTVDLLRDGRPAAAFANVALSLALCLGATFAGYALATTTRTSTIASRPQWLGGDMTVLATLHDPARAPATLTQLDHVLALTGGDAQVLAIDTASFPAIGAVEALPRASDAGAFLAQRSLWLGAMRAPLDDWAQAARARGHAARWRDIRGDGRAALLERARLAQVVVIEHGGRLGVNERARIEAALRRAGRPVLLLGPGQPPIGDAPVLAIAGNAASLAQTRPWRDKASDIVPIPAPEGQADPQAIIASAADTGATLVLMRAPDADAPWLEAARLPLLLLPG